MTRKNLNYSLAVATLVMAAIAGCKKEAFNINQNPNSPTDSTVSYNVILPAAQNATGRFVARDWGFLQNWLGYWARSGTYAPNVAEETYDVTTSFNSNIWTDIYDNLYDYQVMQRAAQKANASFYDGIARIMKAHDYQMLVDIYNNVPYSQALQGNGNITPKYDKGIDIYKDLLRQLDTAIVLINGANLSTTGPNKTIATDDIIFAGSQVLWKKFANTIKLRILTHLMNGGVLSTQQLVSGIDIPGEFSKIATPTTGQGSYVGFLGAGENAQVQPGYKSDKPNPFYGSYVADATGAATANSVYYKANSYAIGYYEYNGDVREGRFYKAGSQGFRGVKYGLPSATENAAATLAGIGDGVAKTNSAAQWLITGTESLFMQAEAMHRGFLSGSPNATLKAGITESFVMLGLTAAQATTYMNNNAGYGDVDYTAPALASGKPPGGLVTIISQKWFSLNAIAPFEVWSDYRRVDYNPTINHFVYGDVSGYDPGPPISVSPSNTKTQIPIRLFYPQNEYNYNAANVGAEGTINASTSKIFWDLR